VLYEGKQQFIRGLTVHHAGVGVGMIVWLAGNTEAIDSADVQIKPASPSEENKHV
jgi:hypothetical protein